MMNALIPLTHFDEMMDSFFGSQRTCAPASGQTARCAPRADILEGEQDFQIRLEIPGFSREDLSLELEDQTLTIKAEREFPVPESYQARRRELPDKLAVQRAFNLGKEIEAEKISAKLEHGILLVTLPKAEQVLPRRIDVQ